MSPQQAVTLNLEVTVKIPGAARTSYIRICKWDSSMQSVLKAPQVTRMLPRSGCHTLTNQLTSPGEVAHFLSASVLHAPTAPLYAALF